MTPSDRDAWKPSTAYAAREVPLSKGRACIVDQRSPAQTSAATSSRRVSAHAASYSASESVPTKTEHEVGARPTHTASIASRQARPGKEDPAASMASEVSRHATRSSHRDPGAHGSTSPDVRSLDASQTRLAESCGSPPSAPAVRPCER